MLWQTLFLFAFSILAGIGKAGPLVIDTSNVHFERRIDPTTTWHAIFVDRPKLHLEIVDTFQNTSYQVGFLNQTCVNFDLMITGGFFELGGSSPRPVGLHQSGGKVHYDEAEWASGGYLVVTPGGEVSFPPVGRLLPRSLVLALQSKPFLLEEGEIAINRVPGARWDRIAIGTATYDGDNGLFVVAAISG